MAVPIRLHNIPEYLRSAQLSDYCVSAHTQGTQSQEILQFPKSTCVLWDGTSTGSPVFLHVAQNRKPRLQLWEKLLWLIHKQVDSDGSANRVLVGSLVVEQDADGVSFKIDRLDTRQTNVNASLLQDDVLIPVQISTNSNQEKTGGSREDYAEAIKMLQKRCSSHESLELNNLLLVKGWCSMRSHQQADKTVVHLQFDLVTLANVFKATPVNPVPIIPSALAKNLAGPRNLSHMQGRPKMGYLSMDATRKLLLVLESDPKVASLPVVGIWVSGISMVDHPFVWGSCLRYLQNERLQDRVCTPPEGFLLVMYSSLHSRPEFYEIATTSGKPDLQFDLYTGYEITSLSKKSSGPEPGVIEWELSPVRNGPKREMFDAALESAKSQKQEADQSTSKPSISSQEDIMPRMTPAPHQSKAMTVRPMVPELSMIWNDNTSPTPSLQPFSSAPSPPVCLNAAFSAPCSTSASATMAPVFSEKRTMGFVPSSQNCGASDVTLTGSGAGHCCGSIQQDSDCIPRSTFPAQYQQTQSVGDQNSGARTGVPASCCSVPTGVQGMAYSNSIPQPAAGVGHFPHSHVGNEYSNISVPQHSSQGHACASVPQYAHPQQHQMYIHSGFSSHPRSQNHPRPRLMAPAGMHFCRPDHASPAVRPAQSFPPSVGGQRSPHSSPVPQHLSGHGQHFHAGVPASFSHPHAQRSPAPHYLPVQTDCQSKAQAAVSQMNQANSIASYQRSAPGPGTVAPVQGALHHSQGTVTGSQGQPWPPPRHAESTGACSWQPGSQSPAAFPSLQPWPGHQSAATSHTQMPAGKSQETQPPGCPSGEQTPFNGYTNTVPLDTQSPAPSVQTANSSHSLDHTSSSAKSSDDSGLSVTPDCSNPSPKQSHSASPQAKTGASGPQALSLENVNWAGVPNEVVQLLIQQDAQLKMLQAQIQQLLSQQQQVPTPSPSSMVSTPTPVPSSGLSTPCTLKRETCSTAVNTTMLDSGTPWAGPGQGTHCASIQTSPQKPLSPHPLTHSPSSSTHSQDVAAGQQRGVCAPSTPGDVGRSNRAHPPCRQEAGSMGETPSDLRHQGPVALSSTEHEESPGKVNSLHSTGSVEHPSPVRSMESHLQLSNSTPSPPSASMCVRPDENEDGNDGQEVSPDSKEYYDQLINNIRLFLNSHSQDADSSVANRTDTVTAAGSDTNAGLKMFDSTVETSPSPPAGPSGGASNSSNTTLIPHINYLSMVLGSDTDASLEINAMAMKYLHDEQLTQVARHHQSPQHGGSSHLLLRQALAASLDVTGASDISRLGLSANNLSMATKKYLEKHGLLGGGQGESLLDTNQTIRLQTDFSLAVMSECQSHPSLPPSPQKAATPQPANAQSPVKREVLKPPFKPSPVIVEEGTNLRAENDRRWPGDLGASPALRPAHCYQRDSSPEDTPIFPERFHGPPQQGLISDCSLATEDDRILDIEKLKQMPKLL